MGPFSVLTLQELECAHMAAAEELESLYEKRLKLEAARVNQMASTRDDVQFRSEETVARLRESHKADMAVGVGRRVGGEEEEWSACGRKSGVRALMLGMFTHGWILRVSSSPRFLGIFADPCLPVRGAA